ncbi:MAG: stage III sporulation protein AB [Oscillospiraceae bacterium]|nr:stage III sporulation protein AB [Oscillospiraceae bacterium]
MLSIVGAILIIGATTAVGLSGVWRMGLRIRSLTGLLTAIETMKSEICDRLTPMPELIEQLTQETSPPVDRFFQRVSEEMATIGLQSFYFIWKAAVDNSPELELTASEKQTLTDLGRSLGRYDTEQQRDALAYAGRRLESDLHRAEEQRRTQGRVHAVLGIVVGVFVVIILL